MNSKHLLFATIAAILLVSGCTQQERADTPPASDSGGAEFGELDAGSAKVISIEDVADNVGEVVVLEGCLWFNCPTARGTSYPEDCMISICSEQDMCLNNLEFEETAQHWISTLNGYFEESSSSCVGIKIKGAVVESKCIENDFGCESTYAIRVAELALK